MIRPLIEIPVNIPAQPGQLPTVTLQCVGNVRVLILDDDRDVCDLMRHAIGHFGLTIDAAHHADEIESRLKSGTYHLIILDYVIPGLPFEQVTQWLKEFQPGAGIIVVTGYPSIDSALTCLRAHTYDYLIKPLKIAELREAVTRCLTSKGLLRMSEEALREALGGVIRERRKSLGMTLSQLAERTELSVGYLSQIELGKNSASIETLYRIALGLGVNMADLFQSVRRVE